jgi:hypothetical protein
MKIVVIDSGQLPAGVEFPPLQAAKYGWEQYIDLDEAGIAERCWRTDIVISLATAINNDVMDKMIKLGMVIVVGEACDRLGADAVGARQVKLISFPGVDLADQHQAQQCCDRIVNAIDDYIQAASSGDTN